MYTYAYMYLYNDKSLVFINSRVLKNNRTKIHMNLFVAIVLQVIMRLITYSTPDLDENPVSR